MTDMKRMTISMPDEIDRKIMEMKKDDSMPGILIPKLFEFW